MVVEIEKKLNRKPIVKPLDKPEVLRGKHLYPCTTLINALLRLSYGC